MEGVVDLSIIDILNNINRIKITDGQYKNSTHGNNCNEVIVYENIEHIYKEETRVVLCSR